MFDLATAKTRLNITDATQDVALQGALDAALALAENYCDRQFLFATQRAKFYHVHGETLQLRRYPVVQVAAFTPTGKQYKMHHVTGVIEFHRPQIIEEVVVDYSGGYQTLPADLELALWAIFDQIWAAAQTGGGGALTAGAIQSVTLADVGTVRYATGAVAAAAATGASMIPATALNILDFYVCERA